MKWQSILAGVLASVFGTLFIAGTASADVRIVNDPGGEVSSYLRTFYEVRATGERIVIDEPCLSACTHATLVEFFDYNCPYCKQMAPVMAQAEESDPHLCDRAACHSWLTQGLCADFCRLTTTAPVRQCALSDIPNHARYPISASTRAI
jgi:thiol-disulfide isomerase/thioredoxin